MSKPKKEKMKALVNGELVDMDTYEPEEKENFVNEPLDRSRIDDATKKELGKLLKKLPEIKPIIEILIGKKAVKELK